MHTVDIRRIAITTVLAATLGLVTASAAHADAEVKATGDFHADFEIDPTAYVLNGHSLHVGLGYQRFRLDLGAFAMDLPQALTGNDQFHVGFNGYGAKLQYFLFSDEQRGGFVGIDGGLVRPLVKRRGAELAVRTSEVSLGVNFGWRFVFLGDFYATAWLGLSMPLGREVVTMDGATYEGQKVTVFPAVHLGYRFR